MRIIIPKTIQKKEKYNYNKKHFHKLKFNLFTEIKGDNLPKNSSLVKLYVTSSEGHKRIVFLVDNLRKDFFLLFNRSKKDKIGKNISIQNRYFKDSLNKHLDMLNTDLIKKNYSVYIL